MAAVTGASSSCGSCKKCVKSNQYGLQCEGFCTQWFHIGCVTISKKDYEHFQDLGDKIVWFCPTCLKDIRDLICTGKDSTEKEVDQIILNDSHKDKSPALSVVLDEISSLNSNYLALEKRIIELECVKPRLADTQSCDTGFMLHQAEKDCIASMVDDGSCKPSGIRNVGNETTSANSRRASKNPRRKWNSGTTHKSEKSTNETETMLCEAILQNDNDVDLLNENGGGSVLDEVRESSALVKSGKPSSGSLGNSELPKLGSDVHGRKLYSKVVAGGKSAVVKRDLIIGLGLADEKAKISAVGKSLWVFISRLEESVKVNDITDHLRDICGDVKVNCEELKPKFPGYKSFKVELPYSTKGKVFDPSAWPKNVLVSKFIFPKNKNTNRPGLKSPPVKNQHFLGHSQTGKILT